MVKHFVYAQLESEILQLMHCMVNLQQIC